MADIRNNYIMLVDDDLGLRKLFETELKLCVSDVFTAQNGLECLDLLRKLKRIDIIILDLKMPKMDGLTLLEHLKNEFPDVLPIIMTGYGDKDSVKKALQCGAFDFLEKPVRLDMFNYCILRAIEHFNFKRMQRLLLQEVLFQYNDISPESFEQLSEQEKKVVLDRVLGLVKMRSLKRELKNV